MAQQEVEFPSDDAREYYAILNIPRDASDDEVRRAYRTLAQVYHPDKHTNLEQKTKAKEAFGRLQEAYEVLSDPSRRQVYDVYGKDGLVAGFEVGTKLESVEELRKKWEEFKKKQEAERAEQQTNYRGLYQCRLDASDLRTGLSGQRPLFRAVTVQNSIDVPVAETDVFYMQGQAALRNNAGAGNLIFGYRRVLSPHDTLEGSAVLGLRSALSLSSTRQLTPYTSAVLTTGYTAGVGVSMQVGTTRHLPYNMQATLGWVVGPEPASGLTFSITKRGRKYLLAGKLDLGAISALSGRLVYHVSPAVNLRAIARLGVTGVDLELGAGRKWGANTSGYVGTLVGLQGITVKGRLVRGGQTFDLPVVVSQSYTDVRLLAAAYLLPPLTYVLVSRCVVRPIVRWHRARQERQQQREHADAIREALQKAAAECSLIEPVARRKARSEAAKRPTAGLVILDAVYGNVESYLADGGPQQAAVAAAVASVPVSDVTAAEALVVVVPSAGDDAGGTPAAAALSGATADRDDNAAASTSGRDGGRAAAAMTSGTAAAPPPSAVELPLPPPWLSVTAALQYQVNDSKLTLHPGVPKKNHMGFADPTPGATTIRRLYVAYLHGNRVYEVTVDDTDGLHLPDAGEAVADDVRQQALLQLGAAALGVPELLQPPQAAAGAPTTPSPS